MSRASAFVAFGSERPDISETMRLATAKIEANHDVALLDWTKLQPGGKLIINRVCQEIAQRDMLICDLTTQNPNVLFELGFAVAQRKRVWPVLNTAVKDAHASLSKLQMLTTIGYVPYQNSDHLVTAFGEQRPDNDLESTVFRDEIESVISTGSRGTRASERRAILYLKSAIETDASTRLARAIDNSPLTYWLDDPAEVATQSLSWYAKHVFGAQGVVAHFLSPTQKGARAHNAKLSLVCGMAYGMHKSLLMMAHAPYETVPLDYRDLLKVHDTAQACEIIAEAWLEDVHDPFLEALAATRSKLAYPSELTGLGRIALGEYVSENEPDSFREYFVQTAEFTDALSAKHAVFAGRKGSGKTANLLMLKETLEADKRNHVCVIKPVSYELHGLVALLEKTIPKAEKSYLIESLWKFLVYSELVASVYDRLKDKPPYLAQSSDEQEFVVYVEAHRSTFLTDFSIRLDNAVSRLEALDPPDTAEAHRRRVSELLHEDLLSTARQHLGRLLTDRERVVVLIDNLDKAWIIGPQLPILGETLFRLLSVSQSITRDFDRADHWREPVNLAVIIFLRSDIFDWIHRSAREPDKIVPKRLLWRDQELLLRVIEERFMQSLPAESEPSHVWPKYFPETVRGEPVRDYLYNAVLPKPRDLVFLVREALATAVNRRHEQITEDDLEYANYVYSQHAFDSLVVEAGVELEAVDELLIELVGGPDVVEHPSVLEILEALGYVDQRALRYVLGLVKLSFFGLEARAGEFRFVTDDNHFELEKLMVQSRKTAEATGRRRYKINRPFQSFLEVSPID